MPNITTVVGVRQVINNLRARDRSYGYGIARGLKKGGLLIQRTSQLQAPVEFGNLKASAFTRATGTGFQTKVTVGYTAAYAPFVHERVKMSWKGLERHPNPPHKGRYWDPQGRAKAHFLSDPVRTEAKKVTEIVRDEAFRAKWS